MPNFSIDSSVFMRAAEQYETPFHLYDEQGIRKTAQNLNKAFSWAPKYKEFFAVKALPNPHILNILKEEHCGVDCSSECELLLAQMCAFSGEDIMFSANAMPKKELKMAYEMGAHINLDDYNDIALLKEVGGITDTVSVRYNPGGVFTLDTNSIMGNPGESKYGFTKEQMVKGLQTLKALGVQKFGMHAFLASNVLDEKYYPALSGILFDTANEVAKLADLPLDYVNLSGGIGIPYTKDEKEIDIFKVGAGVQKEYERVFGDASKASVKIYTELGRYMTGPHGFVVARAVHEKNTYKNYIGLDACAVQLIRPAMYGAYHEISIVGKEHAPCTHVYDITGSLCENNDKFAIDRKMPPIQLGDLLIIHDAGAHAFSMGYQYNSRLRTAEVLYKKEGSFALIRRKETPEDYFATLV